MFSIIIPLYNKAAYIRKAIDSVFNQTYPEFELIVLNDGSTDDSFVQLSAISYQLSVENPGFFGKLRIVNQENQGVSSTRNSGVRLAKYDYIAFLDADDWWSPSYLEEMKKLIESFPTAGLYGSNYYLVKNGRMRIAPIAVEASFKSGLINYFQVYANRLCQPIWTGAAIIPKSIFESENGFKPRLKMGEDFDLWLRVALKHPVALLNKPLSFYNQDVDETNRAIGVKLYEPEQYMLFSDYADMKKNPDFRLLFEVLAVYGLLKYYLAGKNPKEVQAILSTIHWENHPYKYKLYYKILPKPILKLWMKGMKMASNMKKKVLLGSKKL